MGRNFIFVGAMVLSMVNGFAQEPPQPAKATHVAVPKDTSPVTADEANTVLKQESTIISKAFGHPMPTSFAVGKGSTPVTREAIVAAFTRQFDALSPEFKFTPNPQTYNATILRIAKPQLPSLERLIRFGCIGKVAPLATGPKDSLTIAEFGDALGFFMSRLAELTYMPDPKWTPTLEGPGGPG